MTTTTQFRKPAYLLSIDLDDIYSPVVDSRNTNYFEQCTNFLSLSRKFFTVIHVWHDTSSELTELKTANVVPFSETSNHTQKFPRTSPESGEFILGKPRTSAFKNTNLNSFIPKGASIFVIGVARPVCVAATLKDGITHGYNMIVIDDLIAEQPNSKGIPASGFTDSRSIAQATHISKQILAGLS